VAVACRLETRSTYSTPHVYRLTSNARNQETRVVQDLQDYETSGHQSDLWFDRYTVEQTELD